LRGGGHAGKRIKRTTTVARDRVNWGALYLRTKPYRNGALLASYRNRGGDTVSVGQPRCVLAVAFSHDAEGYGLIAPSPYSPVGTKTGNLIHKFTGGSVQKILTDVSIDPVGNVWIANNWRSP
jgi:hypothetical protein